MKNYDHDYVSYAKKRWIGQTLYKVYTGEFKAFSKKYYEEAIKDGRISVNNKTVDLDYVI